MVRKPNITITRGKLLGAVTRGSVAQGQLLGAVSPRGSCAPGAVVAWAVVAWAVVTRGTGHPGRCWPVIYGMQKLYIMAFRLGYDNLYGHCRSTKLGMQIY